MGIALRHELRLEKLRERLIDRPNNVNTTVQLGENVLESNSVEIISWQACHFSLYRFLWRHTLAK